ncbi:MAG: WD40 repeat-containing protein [Parcubacteria group bacterium Gr01-1014_18]|nr:MAG: WD40 repeat-containing protein [Parcubacteria group bacterium Greene0416_36]TSC81059.1 MAG: WD40 repeat-containing protein [Parcubacteria group bacterium Gr01-1014_18]TSC98793.1 MAG: WD40 repeat-containing protein [Parcubacteria group bacterium Greene1014_20]TSD06727.1 MAG: WD40 repeat-containing protein [Parcubacteria group bacterium Greene0714_2]
MKQNKKSEVQSAGQETILIVGGKYREDSASDTKPGETDSFIQGKTQQIQNLFFGFKDVKKIGQGGMGTIYKALDPSLDRVVALKMLLSMKDCSPEDVARLKKEAQFLARLQHPNIVGVYSCKESDDNLFIAMEYIEGKNLAEMSNSAIRLDVQAINQRVHWIVGVLDALHYAHINGVIHRDIKPANIMLTKQGVPKLMDFGLAKDEKAKQRLTAAGYIMGTPLYMSPEQVSNSSGVDCRADIYSVGATLYELICGTCPFAGNSTVELFVQILEASPKKSSDLNPHVPKDLENICRKAMEKNPALRYQTAKEFEQDLERYLSGETVVASPKTLIRLVYEKMDRGFRKSPILARFILFLSIFILGAGSYFLVRLNTEKSRAQSAEQSLQQALLLAEEERQTAMEAKTEALSQRSSAMSSRDLAMKSQSLAEQEQQRAEDEVRKTFVALEEARLARKQAENSRMEEVKYREIAEKARIQAEKEVLAKGKVLLELNKKNQVNVALIAQLKDEISKKEGAQKEAKTCENNALGFLKQSEKKMSVLSDLYTGLFFIWLEKFNDAHVILDSILHKHGSDILCKPYISDCFFLKGISYFYQGNKREAFIYFEKAEKLGCKRGGLKSYISKSK